MDWNNKESDSHRRKRITKQQAKRPILNNKTGCSSFRSYPYKFSPTSSLNLNSVRPKAKPIIHKSYYTKYWKEFYFLHLKKIKSGWWITPPNLSWCSARISSGTFDSWHSSMMKPAFAIALINVDTLR